MITAVFLALLGAAAGSCAALVAERLVRGDPIGMARSVCRSCGRQLRARDLVPLVSFLALRGRCASCNARIPVLLVQAELAGAALGGGAALVAPDPLRALLLAVWIWSLLALAIADLRYYRLPDPLVLTAGVLGIALMLAGDGTGWPPLGDRILSAALGALAGGGSFWLIRAGYHWRTGRDGMGLGDVKLMAALGAALGLERLPIMVLLAALSALLLALLRAWRKGRSLHRLGRVPFGAALAMAAALVALITQT